MREFTKTLKNEREKDIMAIYAHNNSKIRKRTPEQNEQAYSDKSNFYLNKWNAFLEKAETVAQKNICNEILGRIEHMPKWF